MKIQLRYLLMIITLCFTFSGYAGEKLTIFAAASLTNAMQDIGKAYQKKHQDSQIVFSFASSSVLAKQIEQGAPADIFMSADQKWMTYLIDRHVASNKENLLTNSLVLIAPKDSGLNQISVNAQTNWRNLLPKGERLAIGDPSHVPAGLYAKEALSFLGVYNQLSPQFAAASNVRDALMLVERSEAKLGIVYSTDAKVSKNVKIIGSFPPESFTPIEYPITLLNSDAINFYHYLKSAEAKLIFNQYGFGTSY